MSLHIQDPLPVPEETDRVARAAFPKGNPHMALRDRFGNLYSDHHFADLFETRGRPAESPARLALITVMQFAEGLSDRQAADAVRARIDWKYALGLELTDPGFNFSVLSEFRTRLIAGNAEAQLLDLLLEQCKTEGLIKARGRQRTDATHVLAAIRRLNRLECVGESLRHTLNQLAVVAPDWLLMQVTPDWFDRYGARFEQYRLPEAETERLALAETIGQDGYHLLAAVYAPGAPQWVQHIPAVEVLRQVWVQQYYQEDGQVMWRADDNLPPAAQLIQSPYDAEARYSVKRSTKWTGYKVHLTETCDDTEKKPHLITHVETTPATTSDGRKTEPIHEALAEKDLLPAEHLVDMAYVDAGKLVRSPHEHGVELVGPVPADNSWQARAEQGFDVACFMIDWNEQTVTCPRGHPNRSWTDFQDQRGHDLIRVRFERTDCCGCGDRPQCTRAKDAPRSLTLRPREEHLALQNARQQQTTAEFQERHAARAGMEGTISQGTRSFSLRRTRYIGLAKTHLQHVAIATAVNLSRIASWLEGKPRARTRRAAFAALADALQPAAASAA